MDCINLKERFGDRYRVAYEESYKAEYGEDAYREDPALMIIPCRVGQIFPWGGSMLAVSVDGHAKVAGRLRRMPCCQVAQDGDDGTTLTFNVKAFDKIARIARPHRRPRLSPERRAELAACMREMNASCPVECELTAPECVSMAASV